MSAKDIEEKLVQANEIQLSINSRIKQVIQEENRKIKETKAKLVEFREKNR